MAEHKENQKIQTGDFSPGDIPEKAFHPETDEGREWWEMVASGSVVLEHNDLEKILTQLEKNDKES